MRHSLKVQGEQVVLEVLEVAEALLQTLIEAQVIDLRLSTPPYRLSIRESHELIDHLKHKLLVN